MATADGAARVMLGDNLKLMRALKAAGAQAALVYMDPPFMKGRVLGAGAASFDDRWPSREAYLLHLQRRLVAAWDLLTPDGCLVLHLDSTSVHHAKVLADRLFGAERFASEIVWRYRRWPSRTQNFQRVHDTLLRYVRDPARVRWVQQFEPLAASTLAVWGTKRQAAQFTDGQRVRSQTTDADSPGVPMGDVWDISMLAPSSRERTGYPTQKPSALLERLVASVTHPGDLVVDPYVGSGTTLAACLKLGRLGLGIDSNPEAVRIARERMSVKASIGCNS